VFLDYTAEQRALRDELRAYFDRLLTPEIREELGPSPGEHCGPVYRRVARQIGEDGWLGIGWPTEYGGQGRGAVEQFIFFSEARRATAPIPVVTLNTVGPTLMAFGSEEQKRRFLPGILRGEIHFAIGYSEPGSGTDLASLITRAVRDGDGYRINGQKVFTTGAHDADYIWLAARTDPQAPKHKGITIFIVDTGLPGFKVTPIETLDGGRTNATFYEDIHVPASAVVGKENEGWRLITAQLNHERVALAPPGRVEGLLDDVVAWARETNGPGGRPVIDEPWARLALARVKAKVDALRLLNWRLAWELSSGVLNPADASAVKVYGSELFVEAYRLLLEVVGQAGALRAGSPGAVLSGRLERVYQSALVLTFGGGVNEVQREIIATVGLGLPRSPREVPAPVGTET
jgi:alkylation response protein AidB-like acyl-CoA dehydrogenase